MAPSTAFPAVWAPLLDAAPAAARPALQAAPAVHAAPAHAVGSLPLDTTSCTGDVRMEMTHDSAHSCMLREASARACSRMIMLGTNVGTVLRTVSEHNTSKCRQAH